MILSGFFRHNRSVRSYEDVGLGSMYGSLVTFAFILSYCFFFQAEDGIRDIGVTGVQTCALPIFFGSKQHFVAQPRSTPWSGLATLSFRSVEELTRSSWRPTPRDTSRTAHCSSQTQIGRASCRERV